MIGAFTFYAAFGPGGEIENLVGLATPSASGLWGAALVMTLYTYPFVLLTTRASLLSQDASLVNAARTLGMSLTGALWRVVLPRAVTGIAAGGLLAALYALSDFGTPAIMGLDTLTRVIYVEYNAFGLNQAAMLSLQLLAIVGLVLFLESRLKVTQERPGRSLTLWPRGWQIPALVVAAAPVILLAIVLPLSVFSIWLVREGSGGFELAFAWNSTYASCWPPWRRWCSRSRQPTRRWVAASVASWNELPILVLVYRASSWARRWSTLVCSCRLCIKPWACWC